MRTPCCFGLACGVLAAALAIGNPFLPAPAAAASPAAAALPGASSAAPASVGGAAIPAGESALFARRIDAEANLPAGLEAASAAVAVPAPEESEASKAAATVRELLLGLTPPATGSGAIPQDPARQAMPASFVVPLGGHVTPPSHR